MIYKKCVGNISRLFFNMSFLEGIEFFFNSTKKLRAMQTHCTCWVHNALDKCTHHVDIFIFSFWINHSRIFSFSLMFLPFFISLWFWPWQEAIKRIVHWIFFFFSSNSFLTLVAFSQKLGAHLIWYYRRMLKELFNLILIPFTPGSGF